MLWAARQRTNHVIRHLQTFVMRYECHARAVHVLLCSCSEVPLPACTVVRCLVGRLCYLQNRVNETQLHSLLGTEEVVTVCFLLNDFQGQTSELHKELMHDLRRQPCHVSTRVGHRVHMADLSSGDCM